MAWKKTPQGLVELFHELLPRDPRAERRKMFGYPCSFVNGNLWAGLHQDDLLLRLDEASRKELLMNPEAHTFEPMSGRPMREYVVVPPSMHEDVDELQRWIDRAFAFGLALPAKTPKLATRGRAAAAGSATKKPSAKKPAASKPAARKPAKPKRTQR